jgi:hypothetical protein
MRSNLDNLLNNSLRILMWNFINPLVSNSMNSSIRNSIHRLVESPIEQSSIGTKIWDSAIDSIDKLNEKSL